MRVLYCRDAGFDCEGVVEGEDETTVLAAAADHAREVHGVEATPELAEQLRAKIRDAGAPAAAEAA